MRKRFTGWGHCVGHQWSYDHICEYMNIMRVNIECFTGCKRIKQRRISFDPGYLRMILWKISTAISIKHRIFATFNIKKKKFWVHQHFCTYIHVIFLGLMYYFFGEGRTKFVLYFFIGSLKHEVLKMHTLLFYLS